MSSVVGGRDTAAGGLMAGGSACSSNSPAHPRVRLGPLEAFREGLALARRAGMTWQQAQHPAREAALSVIPSAEELDPRLSRGRIKLCGPRERAQREAERDNLEQERDEWACVLYDTRTAWWRAYERRPTGCAL